MKALAKICKKTLDKLIIIDYTLNEDASYGTRVNVTCCLNLILDIFDVKDLVRPYNIYRASHSVSCGLTKGNDKALDIFDVKGKPRVQKRTKTERPGCRNPF